MGLIRSFCSAFAMYSRIPVPAVEWKEENRRYALCFFPLVGAVIGLLLLVWRFFGELLSVGTALKGAVSCLIPLLITGGIHMDGFCDVMDAKASCQTKAKKLEIMSDPHIGAFALIWAFMYILIQYGLFCQIDSKEIVWICAIGYILSRSLSGLAAVTFYSAKKEGALQSFAKPAHKKVTILVLVCEIAVSGIVMLSVDGIAGMGALIAAGLSFLQYRRMSYREFGGITGDLAGYFLQNCELSILGAAVGMEVILPRICSVLL